MFFRSLSRCLLCCAGALVVGGCSSNSASNHLESLDPTARAAADKIQADGGVVDVKLDEAGKPIVSVAFKNGHGTNADLPEVAVLPNVQSLSLESSSVDGPAWTELKKLPALRVLNVSDSRITDEDLGFLAALPQLQDLKLMRTRITDKGLPALLGLKSLERLNLAQTMIDDAGVEELLPLQSLKQLQLWNTAITDQALETLAKFPNLEELHIIKTNVSDDAAKKLLEAKPNLKIFGKLEKHPAIDREMKAEQ
ncbi:MAG TPA: hypothetical protein VFE24_00670 [Pirellulales bacterium]|jgi:Leucine-rich repeat (LRR) protein|nr:hypothetical protein [Pirellulales bacterium]